MSVLLPLTIALSTAALPPERCLSFAAVSVAATQRTRIEHNPVRGTLTVRRPQAPTRLGRQWRALPPSLIQSVETDGPALEITLTHRSILVNLRRLKDRVRVELCELRGPALAPLLRADTLLPLQPPLDLWDPPLPRLLLSGAAANDAAHQDLARALATGSEPALKHAALSLRDRPHGTSARADALHVLAWLSPPPSTRRIEALEEALVEAPDSPLAERSRALLMRLLVDKGRWQKVAALTQRVGPPQASEAGLLFERAVARRPGQSLGRLAQLAQASGPLHHRARFALGIARWQRGDFARAISLLVEADEREALDSRSPAEQLMAAEALRIDHKERRAIRVLRRLSSMRHRLCAVAALRLSDLQARRGRPRLARRALQRCPQPDSNDRALLRMRLAELRDMANRRHWRNLYRVALSDGRRGWLHPEIRLRWARKAFLDRLDGESLVLAQAVSSAPDPMIATIAGQAMRDAVERHHFVRAAVIFAGLTPEQRSPEILRIAAQAFTRMSLDAERISALQQLLHKTEPDSIADQVALLQAYKQAGEMGRAVLVARHLQEQGFHAHAATDIDVPPALCPASLGLLGRALCRARHGDSDDEVLALSPDPVMQQALELALSAHRKRGEQP